MPAISTLPSSASMNSRSMQSIGNQIGYKVRNIAHYGQPTVDINLDNSEATRHGDYVTSYSTMDTLEGSVSITAPHEMRFEEIDISFIGASQVYVDRLTTTPSMSGRTEATHRFLTLKQPLEDSDLPCPRILAAGKRYTFPFTFTVPAQLLPKACPHRVSNDYVKDQHLMLPPSMGDPELAGFGGVLLDDLAPEMSKIVYGIKVRVTQYRDGDSSVTLLAEKMKKVRVKPAFEEQPPLRVDPSDGEYRMRQEKPIKKGLFKGKLGTLTAQSVQPKALVIPGARTNAHTPITTSAKVQVRFDPADESLTPPRLGSLASKIKVATYYASAPRSSVPARSSLGYDLSQGVYQETISLSTLCVASAQWKKHTSAENPIPVDSLERRDSGISDCSTNHPEDTYHTGIPNASKHYRGGNFYTAQITVPITLPRTKNFLPTFHSCLISRVYTLSLQLTANTPGVGDPSIHLKTPIQICAEGSATGNAIARARHAEAVVAREADDMFTPRSVVAPPEQTGGRAELPPGYTALPQQAGRYSLRYAVAV